MTAPSPITGSSDPAAPRARPRRMTPPASDERRSRTAPRTRRPSAAPASDAPSPTSTTRNDCASAAGCSPADPGPSTRSTDGSRRWSRCSSSPSGPTAAGSPALTRRSRRSRTSRPPARSSARCSTSRPGASGTSRGPSAGRLRDGGPARPRPPHARGDRRRHAPRRLPAAARRDPRGRPLQRALNADALLITLRKNEKGHSPTTTYRDVAISETLFHGRRSRRPRRTRRPPAGTRGWTARAPRQCCSSARTGPASSGPALPIRAWARPTRPRGRPPRRHRLAAARTHVGRGLDDGVGRAPLRSGRALSPGGRRAAGTGPATRAASDRDRPARGSTRCRT